MIDLGKLIWNYPSRNSYHLYPRLSRFCSKYMPSLLVCRIFHKLYSHGNISESSRIQEEKSDKVEVECRGGKLIYPVGANLLTA